MSAEAMFFSKCSHFETKQVFDLKPTLNGPKFSGFGGRAQTSESSKLIKLLMSVCTLGQPNFF